MKFKVYTDFIKKNSLLSFLFFLGLFIGVIVLFRIAFPQSKEIYVKLKVGQALTYETTTKPDITFIRSIRIGDIEKNVLGQQVAKIVGFKYYPVLNTDQYDVYMVIKLKVNVNRTTKGYTFNRFQVSVASPLELDFPSMHVIGTISQFGSSNFSDNSTYKIIYLTKKYAYPWEYEGIKVGDSYSDGHDKVFEVLDKKLISTNDVINAKSFAGSYLVDGTLDEQRDYILVKAKVKTEMINGNSVFEENQVIQIGRTLNVSTPRFIFNDFQIGNIE